MLWAGPIRWHEGRDQVRDLLLDRLLLVPGIPEQREAAARTEDPVQLRQRLVVPEPVERLPDRHAVDAPVR